MNLKQAMARRATDGLAPVADALNDLIEPLANRYNSDIGERLLSSLPSEQLPTDPRSVATFRGRVALLMEYSLLLILDEYLGDATECQLEMTFNTLNEFADYFVRDQHRNTVLRIDAKTLHDMSAEYSARYDTPIRAVKQHEDMLFFIAWQWKETGYKGVTVRMPYFVDGLFIPALEIAEERDLRQRLVGGSFDSAGVALGNTGNPDSNFGKMARLVHSTRRDHPELSPRIKTLLNLMKVQAEARASEPSALRDLSTLSDGDPTTEATDSL